MGRLPVLHLDQAVEEVVAQHTPRVKCGTALQGIVLKHAAHFSAVVLMLLAAYGKYTRQLHWLQSSRLVKGGTRGAIRDEGKVCVDSKKGPRDAHAVCEEAAYSSDTTNATVPNNAWWVNTKGSLSPVHGGVVSGAGALQVVSGSAPMGAR
eukprot:9504008-Pyramimonas_sp.AAC.3